MTNLRALRKRLGLTQAQFAERYHLTIAAVRGWEGARARRPQGGAAVMLRLIEREPETVARILVEASPGKPLRRRPARVAASGVSE
jgi:putative transcriptional regulator